MTLLVIAAMAVTACDDGPQLKSSDSPQDIISYAIDSLGPNAAKPASLADARELVISGMGSLGATGTEAECLLTLGDDILGGEDALAKLTVSDLVGFQGVLRRKATTDAQRAAIAACRTPESLERQKAQQVSPDFAPALALASATKAAVRNAEAQGLTAKEAACYSEHSFGALTEQQVTDMITGKAGRDARPTGKAVLACLSKDRIDTLAPDMETALIDEKDRQANEKERLREQVDKSLNATTTSTTSTTAP